MDVPHDCYVVLLHIPILVLFMGDGGEAVINR